MSKNKPHKKPDNKDKRISGISNSINTDFTHVILKNKNKK